MPTYQYACTACGHQLEAVQSFADEPLTECPACEGRLRKLFSSVGVVFKGSGFYRTDSRAGATKDGGSTKDASAAKDVTAAKDTSAGKDSGSKDSGSKDSGSKDSGTAKKADTSAKPAAAAA